MIVQLHASFLSFFFLLFRFAVAIVVPDLGAQGEIFRYFAEDVRSMICS